MLFQGGNSAHRLDRWQRRKHQRQRFVCPVLALPQTGDRLVVASIYDQVKTPQAFHGHNLPLPYPLCCQQQGFVVSSRDKPERLPQGEMWTTGRAGIGLRVKTSIQRILVFTLAGGAHHKISHRGVGTVVRQGLDEGKAWTAVRTVGERIEITPVRRVKDVVQAIRTGGHIWENKRSLVSHGRSYAVSQRWCSQPAQETLTPGSGCTTVVACLV